MAIQIEGGKKFGFKHPSDMLDKLQWELENVSRASFSNGREFSYNVINFAVTAWHLMDWVYPNLPETFATQFKNKGEFANWLKGECRGLAACQAIANECKHFAERKEVEPSIELLPMPGWMGVHNDAPARQMIALAIDGTIYDISTVAHKVHSFWLRFLDAQGLCSDLGIEWLDAS